MDNVRVVEIDSCLTPLFADPALAAVPPYFTMINLVMTQITNEDNFFEEPMHGILKVFLFKVSS
jgi:hypothetical protein